MAQQGMEHWRRAIRWTFVGIFAAALAGGLVGRMTAGTGAFDAAAADAGRARPGTTRRRRRCRVPFGDVIRPQSASGRPADGGAGDGGTPPAVGPALGVVGGRRGRRPTRVTPWSPQLASCVGIPARVAEIAPTKVQSPDFSSADKVDAVEDSVSVYPSAADAQAEFAAMAGSKTTACMNRVASPTLQKSMQQEAGSTTTVGVVSFAGLPAGAAAQNLAGFTVTIPIARGGRVLTVTSTQVDFVSGPLLHQVTFNGNGAAFRPSWRRSCWRRCRRASRGSPGVPGGEAVQAAQVRSHSVAGCTSAGGDRNDGARTARRSGARRRRAARAGAARLRGGRGRSELEWFRFPDPGSQGPVGPLGHAGRVDLDQEPEHRQQHRG